jgi:hypothetical protein
MSGQRGFVKSIAQTMCLPSLATQFEPYSALPMGLAAPILLTSFLM